MSADLTISRLAQTCNVGVETVRYYQRRGLLDQPHRPMGGTRRYTDHDVRRLRFIRQAQTAGFTLEEIGELLSLDAGHDRARARALAESRIDALDRRIAELQDARDSLRRLASACLTATDTPCPILTAFEAPAST